MATNPSPANTSEQVPAELVSAATRMLSETFLLYLKTHGFHWNVEGPHFVGLHNLFEEQYTEMWEAIDELAEHMRTMGVYAPTSYAQFSENSAIKDTDKVSDANAMVAELAEGHATLAKTLKEVVALAEKLDCPDTADLATARLEVHNKAAWMLRSILK